MNFEFSDEQAMMRNALARLLAQKHGFEARQRFIAGGEADEAGIWPALAEMGLTALPLPEATGGLGGSMTDVVAICELFGAHLVAGPFLGSIVGFGRGLSRLDMSAEARPWLSGVAEGRIRGAFAHEEGAGTADITSISTRVTGSGTDLRLDGEKRMVLGGGEADMLLVSARGDDGALRLLFVDSDTPGIERIAYRTIDGRRAADIRFADVALPAERIVADGAEPAIGTIVDELMLALAAESVGAMGRLLELSSSYASTRRQFGTPIGQFQVIAHRLADMKIAYTKARATLLYTTAAAQAGHASASDFSLLKAQAGRLGRAIAESAVQIHGGIGMTDELAVGHYLKRILAVDAMFGSADHHLAVVGRAQAAA